MNIKCLLILICLVFSSIQKKTKEQIINKHKPSNMSNEMYCAACFITTDTISKRRKDGMKEMDILSVVSESCNQKKGFYSQYKYFKARELKDACDIFISIWDEKLEKWFVKNKSTDHFEKLCNKTTYACNGIWEISEIENKMKQSKDDL